MKRVHPLWPPPYDQVMAQVNPTDPVSRVTTTASEEDAIPDGDPNTATGLLLERLRAYKHMVSYLEEYIKAVSKCQSNESKEQEKILKVASRCSSQPRTDSLDIVYLPAATTGSPFRPRKPWSRRPVRKHSLQYFCHRHSPR